MDYIWKMIGVITGDLINSRQLEDQGQWQKALKDLFATIAPGPQYWDIYRGDSFQIEIQKPEELFTVTMQIKASIRSFKNLDVRLAIGIGEKTFEAERITESNGPAFIHSGELLEYLKAHKLSLAIRSSWNDWDEEINAGLQMALVIMDQWKPKTAQLVKAMLDHPGKAQQEIADLLQIQQAGVSQGLKRSHLSELLAWDLVFRKKMKTQSEAYAALTPTPDRPSAG